RHPASGCTSLSIPRGSMAWVRARRASLALLPQLPHHHKSSTGAHAHRRTVAQGSKATDEDASPGVPTGLAFMFQGRTGRRTPEQELQEGSRILLVTVHDRISAHIGERLDREGRIEPAHGRECGAPDDE